MRHLIIIDSLEFLCAFSQQTCEEETDVICEVSPLVSYAGEVRIHLTYIRRQAKQLNTTNADEINIWLLQKPVWESNHSDRKQVVPIQVASCS